MAPKTEKLAKIYLEGRPAEISEETRGELCEFIMSQFRALPFAVQASNSMRYETVEELFADIPISAVKIMWRSIYVSQDSGCNRHF